MQNKDLIANIVILAALIGAFVGLGAIIGLAGSLDNDLITLDEAIHKIIKWLIIFIISVGILINMAKPESDEFDEL